MLWLLCKQVLKKILPDCLLNLLWKSPTYFQVFLAYVSFRLAPKRAQKLSWEDLDRLEKRYVVPFKPITPDARIRTCRRQIEKLMSLMPGKRKPDSLLETGAGDGLYSITAFREYHIPSTAIDLKFKPSPELEKNTIPFYTMDVQKMDFQDSMFECVVSYDAFEHFMEPEKALSEMLRVTKPGGFVYIDFGPLYYSALGLHVYNCIHVPYSQYLFDYAMMEKYIEKNALRRIVPKTLNGWRLSEYERLWEQFSDRATILHYEIANHYYGLELIRRYPGLFKAQTTRFRDLINSHIRILFQKK